MSLMSNPVKRKKERLIELIRNHECLYNPYDKNYRNTTHRTIMWENIGKELNVKTETAKSCWKMLRDGYNKYKKVNKQRLDAEAKPVSFVWSDQLAFLDELSEYREPELDVTVSPSASDLQQTQRSAEICIPPPIGSLPSVAPSQRSPPVISQPGASWMQTDACPELVHNRSKNDSKNKRNLDDAIQETTDIKNKPHVEDAADKIINYLKNKKKTTHDSIDYLFISYTETFRKFSFRKQAEIKIELAKLFAAAEINEFPCENSSLIHISPGYSNDSQAAYSGKIFSNNL